MYWSLRQRYALMDRLLPSMQNWDGEAQEPVDVVRDILAVLDVRYPQSARLACANWFGRQLTHTFSTNGSRSHPDWPIDTWDLIN